MGCARRDSYGALSTGWDLTTTWDLGVVINSVVVAGVDIKEILSV